MAWLPAAEALAVRERLKPLLSAFDYASCLPFGREPDASPDHPEGRLGLVLRAAAVIAPDAAALAPLRTALGLDDTQVLAYQDARRGQQRALRISREGGVERLRAFWVAGDASGDAWLRTLLEADQSLPGPGRQLLAPGALVGKAAPPRSPQVCTCFNVSQAAINEVLQAASGDADTRLAAVQAQLHCGTQCGSCLPTLRTLARQSLTHVPRAA
jgi:assimilatory nitrate reductase catalytic subunit